MLGRKEERILWRMAKGHAGRMGNGRPACAVTGRHLSGVFGSSGGKRSGDGGGEGLS